MELRHLRYFVAIAEERSFTRAAERLWVAQPGLSTQIRRLEAELGVRLFERHPRGVASRQAGELFLDRARVALAATDSAAATGRDLEAGVIGSLALGIAGGPGGRRRPTSCSASAASAPAWRSASSGLRRRAVARSARSPARRAADAGRNLDRAELRTLDLGAAEWVVLIGAGHPLAGIGPVAAADLEGESVAVTATGTASRLTGRSPMCSGSSAWRCTGDGRAVAGIDAAVASNELARADDRARGAPGRRACQRRLDPRRTLAFELLWRDETPHPALAGFLNAAAAHAPRRPLDARVARRWRWPDDRGRAIRQAPRRCARPAHGGDRPLRGASRAAIATLSRR